MTKKIGEKLKKMFIESLGRKFVFESEMDNIKKIIIKDFCIFCQEKLGIKELPLIKIVSKRGSDMSTGAYVPQLNRIKVLAGKRALLDILRSIAHELVHRSQDEKGLLKDIGVQGDRGKDDKSDIGVWFEDEANAGAGALVKEFSRTYHKVPSNSLYEL
jgi:hypothetical protein